MLPETHLAGAKKTALNPRSPMPLYHQLADILMGAIRAGHYVPGARLPSEIALASTYSIGRPTVRQALQRLADKNLIERRRGAGTFVCPQKKEVDLFSLAGTLSAFQKSGVNVKTRILDKMCRINVPASETNPLSGQAAYQFTRLTYANTAPVLLEVIYLHAGLFDGIDSLPFDKSALSELVEEHYFMRPTGGRQTFHIGYPDAQKARHLCLTIKDPVLVVERYLNFPKAPEAVFAKLFCKTEQFVFSQKIGAPLS